MDRAANWMLQRTDARWRKNTYSICRFCDKLQEPKTIVSPYNYPYGEQVRGIPNRLSLSNATLRYRRRGLCHRRSSNRRQAKCKGQRSLPGSVVSPRAPLSSEE